MPCQWISEQTSRHSLTRRIYSQRRLEMFKVKMSHHDTGFTVAVPIHLGAVCTMLCSRTASSIHGSVRPYDAL